MEIKVLASSSLGNAYLISDGKTQLLLECGLSFKELKKRSNYEVPLKVDACFISHEHHDHSKAVKDLLNASVDCYMLEETAEAKGVLNHHRTKILKFNTAQKVGSFWVLPLQMYHDVPCAGFFIVSIETGQKLLFATDTYMIEYNLPNLNYIMIEANYSLDLISDDTKQDRTYKTHMSIDTCIKYLKSIELSNVRTIYLMHLSSRNSDALDFKRRVQTATGKPVYICLE